MRYMFDLLITTVRPVVTLPPELKGSGKHNPQLMFEVISPQKRVLVMAKTLFEMNDWMTALKESTRISLNRIKGEADRAPGKHLLTVLRQDPPNRVCADCGRPHPEWCSINLGVVICISCSAFHRALGAHISKVRSLTIDKLPKPVEQSMLRLGNKILNSELEAHFVGDCRKAIPGDLDHQIGEYIHDKYINRKFSLPVDPNQTEEERRQTAEALLFDSILKGDVSGVLMSLLRGASPNTTNSEGQTPIMGAVADPAILSLLLNNGAKCDVVDNNNKTALDHFNLHGSDEMCGELLVNAGCCAARV